MRTVNRTSLYLLGCLVFISCSENKREATAAADPHDDRIWHYSIIDAMRRGVYEGTYTVHELSSHGDFGIGTFNQLNGELVALDGIIYRIPPSGKVEVASESLRSPFTSLSFFDADETRTLSFTGDFEELQEIIAGVLPSHNVPYAIKIETLWSEITVGGAAPVAANDTTALAELMRKRPQYTAEDVQGSMVGYFTPALMSNVDLSPFHFHFISDNRKFAGHLISGKIRNAEVHISIDEKSGYNIELLNKNSRFRRLMFSTQSRASVY